MDRTMDQDEMGIFFLQSLRAGLPSIRGAVIHDPENTACLMVGRLGHDLSYLPVKRKDAGFLLTSAKELHPLNIQCRQSTPKPRNAYTPARPW